jgi:hypothetical protein
MKPARVYRAALRPRRRSPNPGGTTYDFGEESSDRILTFRNQKMLP